MQEAIRLFPKGLESSEKIVMNADSELMESDVGILSTSLMIPETERITTNAKVDAPVRNSNLRWSILKRNVSVKKLQHIRFRTAVFEIMQEKDNKVRTKVSSSENVPISQQGDLDLYSKENVQKRKALESSHRIRQLVRLFWACMPGALTIGEISKETYIDIHSNIFQHLETNDGSDCMKNEEKVKAQLETDWDNDLAKGRGRFTFDVFCSSLFELVDHWTTGIDEEEYAAFIWKLVNVNFKLKDSGEYKPNHFFVSEHPPETLFGKGGTKKKYRSLRSYIDEGDSEEMICEYRYIFNRPAYPKIWPKKEPKIWPKIEHVENHVIKEEKITKKVMLPNIKIRKETHKRDRPVRHKRHTIESEPAPRKEAPKKRHTRHTLDVDENPWEEEPVVNDPLFEGPKRAVDEVILPRKAGVQKHRHSVGPVHKQRARLKPIPHRKTEVRQLTIEVEVDESVENYFPNNLKVACKDDDDDAKNPPAVNFIKPNLQDVNDAQKPCLSPLFSPQKPCLSPNRQRCRLYSGAPTRGVYRQKGNARDQLGNGVQDDFSIAATDDFLTMSREPGNVYPRSNVKKPRSRRRTIQ